MLVQNQKDLLVANKVYGNTSTAFGWAGRNAEYAQYWRKIIREYFAKRHASKLCRKSIHGKIRECRKADRMAKMEAHFEEAPFDFEDTLLPHVKAITQAIKKQMMLTGSSFDLAIYSSCTVLNEIDNSSNPIKDARIIYADEE